MPTMARPIIHSITWSDGWREDRIGSSEETAPCFPLQLEDRELRCWVTYQNGKAKRKKKGQSRRPKPKLWAVMIIEEVQQVDDFAYEFALKRIYRTGERIIRVWVENDPNDQSDDANVIRFISPNPEKLDSLEHHMVYKAAKRVYSAITETWSTQGSNDHRRSWAG